jgi:hypothetical protein
MENISCYMTLGNFIEDKEEIFGYPIMFSKDRQGRLDQKPVNQLISF